MSLLDMRTVILGYAISNAICALVIALLWQQNRSRFAGLGFWLADYLIQFIGISLIALRGTIPDFLSIVISNSLLVGGTLLMFIGLEHFTGKTGPQIHNYLLLVIFTIIQIYFTVVKPNLMARDINIALGHLIICLQCLWLVTRRAESNVRVYTRQLGMAFAALCLVSVGYGSGNLIAPPPGNNFFQSGFILSLSVLSFQMAYIGLTFGLILLVNRRIFVELVIDITERKRAEAALSKSEEGIRTLFENTPIGMFQSTPDGKVIYINPAYATIMGYDSPEQVKDTINRSSVAETIYEDPTRRPVLVNEVGQAEGTWKTFENRYRRKDGKIIDAILTFSERLDPISGEPTLYGFVQDITERKQAEDALRDSERWLRMAQEAAHAGTWEWDLRTNENIWSESLYRLYGLEPYSCQASYEAWQTTIVSEDRPKAEQAVQEAAQNGTALSTEWRVRDPDGAERWLMSRGQPIQDSQGKVIRYVGIVFDITEQKRTELALHDLSRRYEAILDTVPDIIAEVDKHKVYTWVNQAGRQFFGEAVIGKEAVTYFEGEQDTYNKVGPLFNGQGDVFYVESWQRSQDGEKHLLAWWCRSIADADGNVTGALSTARDITQSRLAEAAVREAEEKYRNIFESTLIGIFRTTPDGRYIIVNPAYARILGYDSPDSVMQAVQDIGGQIYVDPNERLMLIEALERQGEISYESRIIRKDGQVVDVRVDDSVVRGPDGQVLYYQGTLLDISEKKRAEEAVRASEDKFSKAFRQSPDLLVISRLKDGIILEINDSWERSLGYSREDLVGRSSLDLGIFVSPEERQKAVDILSETGFVRDFEIAIFDKSGEVHQTELSGEQIQITGEPCILTIIHDVTQRKQAEIALGQRAEELQRLMDTAPIAILMALDPKCQDVIGNQAANQLYGAKEGENISALYPEDERLAFRRFFQNGRELRPEELPIQRATLLGEEVQNAEVEVMLPGGRMLTMLGAASPVV